MRPDEKPAEEVASEGAEGEEGALPGATIGINNKKRSTSYQTSENFRRKVNKTRKTYSFRSPRINAFANFIDRVYCSLIGSRLFP